MHLFFSNNVDLSQRRSLVIPRNSEICKYLLKISNSSVKNCTWKDGFATAAVVCLHPKIRLEGQNRKSLSFLWSQYFCFRKQYKLN